MINFDKKLRKLIVLHVWVKQDAEILFELCRNCVAGLVGQFKRKAGQAGMGSPTTIGGLWDR